MRRSGLLFPFVLIAVGCGGSSAKSGTMAKLLLRVAHSDGIAFGTGTDGSPRLAAYDAKSRTVTVRSTSSAIKVATTGTDFFGVAITGDYLLTTVREGEVDGTRIVDLRTQNSRFDAGEAPLFVEGGRVVWITAAATGFVVEDLATNVRTSVTLGANDQIVALRGTRLLLANVPTNYGDIREATAYRTTDLAGGKIADLALPLGDDYVEVDALDDSGRAVGRAETGGLVGFPFPFPEMPYLWSATGVPSALPNSVAATSLSIGDDGTVLAIDEGEQIHLLKGGTWRGLPVFGLPASLSPDGRSMFVAQGTNGASVYEVRS